MDRPIKVTIPVPGEVTFLARSAGSVYTATLKHKTPQLTLNDPDAMLPTVKGFSPQKVTKEQIKAFIKTSQIPFVS